MNIHIVERRKSVNVYVRQGTHCINRYRSIKTLPWLCWILRTLYMKHDIESVKWSSL